MSNRPSIKVIHTVGESILTPNSQKQITVFIFTNVLLQYCYFSPSSSSLIIRHRIEVIQMLSNNLSQQSFDFLLLVGDFNLSLELIDLTGKF